MEQNKQNPAKIVAMKMAERMNQPATTDGKRNGCLVVIDGKPPMGDTTTMMLYMVKIRAVDEQKPTAYFSLVESNVQVVNRLIAITTGIDHEKIVSGQLSEDDWKAVDEKVPLLMKAPLYVDDTPMMTVAYLKEKLTILKEKGVTLAVIDHVQQMITDRMASIDDLLNDVKTLAEQLGITIIAITE